MKNRLFYCLVILFLNTFLLPMSIQAQDISLPAPDKTGGKPLMQALNERQSIRTFTKDTLTQQQLSDLLWAGWGINRADLKKRTAPSARNVQEIDVYVALPSGLYFYIAESHTLKQINNKDLRKLSGTQDFVAEAALNLVYVADLGKLGKKEGDEIKDSDLLSSYANTAFIAQNIYLYCASANLGCVIRGMVPKEQLAPEMGLRSNQRIILAQTVGVPQK
ncbi:MAG: SagB/ThcOx family dehydrogenase [Bacteroidales bacterium]|nr:SagB/ThcOx family dehydrogenase [Bacteroidales bacterium]MDP3001855.1 SagB/ThcOx family dehydrogenase [Bacteroidales bacterium]